MKIWKEVEFWTIRTSTYGFGIEGRFWYRDDWRVTVQIWNKAFNVGIIDIPF